MRQRPELRVGIWSSECSAAYVPLAHTVIKVKAP